MMNKFSNMDVERLAAECKRQTQRYFQGIEPENEYCFHLFLRAYHDENERALAHLYKIYQPILAGRARKHAAFPSSCRDANLLAFTALGHFYFAVHKEFKHKFKALPQAMAYLYRCLHTTILLDVRDNSNLNALDDEQVLLKSHHDQHETSGLLNKIYSLLPSEEDRLLVRLRYVYEMKPAEITVAYPEKWPTARAVSVTLQRIRRTLSSHPDFWPFTGDDSQS